MGVAWRVRMGGVWARGRGLTCAHGQIDFAHESKAILRDILTYSL